MDSRPGRRFCHRLEVFDVGADRMANSGDDVARVLSGLVPTGGWWYNPTVLARPITASSFFVASIPRPVMRRGSHLYRVTAKAAASLARTTVKVRPSARSGKGSRYEESPMAE